MNSKVVFAFLLTVSVALAHPHLGRSEAPPAAPPAAIGSSAAPIISSSAAPPAALPEEPAATSAALLDDATAQPVTLPASQDSLPLLEGEQASLPILPIVPAAAIFPVL